jgi:hypothetical protein
VLEDSFFREARSDPFEEKIELVIEIPNALARSLANISILRVKGIHAFFFTPIFLKDLFKIFRGFDASFWEFVNPSSCTSGE